MDRSIKKGGGVECQSRKSVSCAWGERMSSNQFTPWRPTLPQLDGLKTSFDGVVWPITCKKGIVDQTFDACDGIVVNGVLALKRTKFTSPLEAWAPNVSLYDVGNSIPTSVTVMPFELVFL